MLKDSTLAVTYIGIENRFVLQGANPEATYRFAGKEGTRIYSYNRGEFIISPTRIGHDTLVLLENGIQVKTFVFEARRINDPKVKIGIVEETRATIARILQYPVIIAFFPELELNLRISVLSFNVEVFRYGRPINLVKNTGPAFSPFLEEQISHLRPGDELRFDIRAIIPGACVRLLQHSITII